jgi:hypothetical protein
VGPMTGYEIYEVATEDLLSEHDDLATALTAARYLAAAIDPCRDAQPSLDGVLDRRGPTRVAVHDARTGALLAEHDDLDAAGDDAELLADLRARDIEQQLRMNGEGHRGGIPVTLVVHDADTGTPCAEITVHTAAVPPRTEHRPGCQ